MNASSWTQQACALTLPDSFTIILENGSEKREVTGQPVQWPLALMFNPEEEDPDNFSRQGEKLKMPEDIRWITDFKAAEAAGMAVRIPLTAAEWEAGFEKLTVLGVRLTADETEGQRLVEELFLNHQFRPDGMELMPQGTPTNHFDDEESGTLASEISRAALYLPAALQLLAEPVFPAFAKMDGQWLTDALGVQPHIFEWLPNASNTDIAEALTMNEALWPATFGYYLGRFLFPAVLPEDESKVREFFTRYVAGRGLLPVLRVGRQPYGIIPATDWSKWTYPWAEEEVRFEKRLWFDVLKGLNGHWTDLAKKVKRVDDLENANNFTESFMNITGLHGVSGEFLYRYLLGGRVVFGHNDLASRIGFGSAGVRLFREGVGLGELWKQRQDELKVQLPEMPMPGGNGQPDAPTIPDGPAGR